jgi:formamidopyrimidine-DNA glycosylase
MTPEMISLLWTVFIMPLLGVLAKYLIDYINVKKENIKTNIDNQQIKELVEIGVNIINTAVANTTQTYVYALRKEGKFGLEEQQIALNKTKEVVLRLMTDDLKKAITKLYGDPDIFIEAKIEEAVYKDKNIW